MSQISVAADVAWQSYGSSSALFPTTISRRNFKPWQPRASSKMTCAASSVAVNFTDQADEVRRQQRLDRDSTAAFLAIGTDNPANCVAQDEYADYYFRITKSDHLTQLKDKMKRICDKSAVKKRYLHHTEEMIDDNPDLLDRTRPSLDARVAITAAALPELAAAAAAKAIHDWGRPASDITHLVVGTYSSSQIPGPDIRIASLLGLRPSVQRTMLYYHGCSAGSSALRVAKDIAENNTGARVLVVCAELTSLISFRAPDEERIDTLVVQALFGDGAGAVIVGADPLTRVERPIFEVVAASQISIPGSEDATNAQISMTGMDYRLSSKMPAVIGDNIEQCLVDALTPTGLVTGGRGEWNSLFWAVHPGGRAILDTYGAALGLEPGKLAASRRVLSEYGNMSGATIIFVLDELRRNHRDQEGEGSCELGVMVGLGPGVTVEVMALRQCPGTRKELQRGDIN